MSGVQPAKLSAQRVNTSWHGQAGSAVFKLLLVLILLLAGAGVWYQMHKPANQATVVTREGIITEVQTLSRLTSVAFSVDTVVTASREGSWQRLWQDKQKGLFIVKGRVLAGVDLSQISAEMVHVATGADGQSTVQISLPPSEIFEVYLDDIQIYDWQTGLFGTAANDPALFEQVQADAKAEVLAKACAGDVLTLAMNNASEQVQALFALTQMQVTVTPQGTGACQISTKTK